jgi:hypothetical protein
LETVTLSVGDFWGEGDYLQHFKTSKLEGVFFWISVSLEVTVNNDKGPQVLSGDRV